MTTALKHLARLSLATLLFAPALGHADAPATPADARPALLRALDGNWTMSGDVMGKPVTYRMRAVPALQGTFTEMRMQDVQVPAQYEAVVFIGYDADSKNIIAHWMDNFGARHSVPHATGAIEGNTIQFTFPYASGKFRDTFTYDGASASWRFELESAQPDGSWKHFARYQVKRN
jgi:hypothetical protein